MAPRFHALLYRRLTVRSHLRPSTPPPLSRSQAQEEHNSSVDGRLTALESVQKIAHEKIVRVLKRMSQQSRSLSIHREQHRELAAALDTVGEETRGLIAREGASDAERVEMRIQLATQLDQARTIVRDQAALQQQRVAQQAEIQQQKVALQQQQAEIQQQKVALQQQQAALEQQEAALQQQQAEMEAANAEHDDLLARCNSLQAFSQTQALAQGHAELAQQQPWQGQAPTAAQQAALDEEADALLAEIEEVEPLGY